MGAGHSHTPTAGSPRGIRTTLAVIIPAAVVIAALMAWMWPSAHHAAAAISDESVQVSGTITAIVSAACPDTSGDPSLLAGPAGCGTAKVKLADGPDAATTIETDLPAGPGAPNVKVGDDVTLLYVPDSGAGAGALYQIIDHQRGNQLWVLVIAFALAVVAFGRLKGLTALGGLVVTFGVLLWFIVPAILDGKSPLLVAIVGSAAIMLTVLYLTHGLSATTSVAVVGTLASLALTGILSAVAVSVAHLTGVTDESSIYLQMDSHLNMQGLLLAGIIIGALGVLDDITVTQSVTIDELAAANPGYGFGQLYRAATRVGRAHIASVINTIILAYAGASLPLMLLISQSSTPLGQILTNQMVAEEIVRSIVGTLGLIAAVPITTALAAFVAARRPRPAPAQVAAPQQWPGYDDHEHHGHDQHGWDRPQPRTAARHSHRG